MRTLLIALVSAAVLITACRDDREGPTAVELGRDFAVTSAPLVAGEVLVSETASGSLRRIAADGSDSHVFHAGIAGPRGLVIESSGDVVVAEADGNLRRVSADGSSSDVFFTGLASPSGLAVAGNGDLIVSEDAAAARLWRVAADGSSFDLVAEGIRSEDVEINADGNFIVLQKLDGGAILSITPEGAVTTVFAGLTDPSDLVIETSGSFVVAETGTGQLVRVAADGSSSDVVIAGLISVEGVTVAPNGDLLAAEFSPRRITRVAADGSSSSTFHSGLNGPDHLLVVSDEPEATEVQIDIRPFSRKNPVNPKSRGVISVAILSTETFDALSVDLGTVTLGDDDANDTPVARRRNGRLRAIQINVDADGDRDLLLFFETPALVSNGDLNWETTELILNGESHEGGAVHGSDEVVIVPRRRRGR